MRIGALAAATGTTPKTIRFYEQAGLLAGPAPDPRRLPRLPRRGRRNSFDFVHSARAVGLTLAEIRGILTIRNSGQPPCAHVVTIIDRHPC